MTKKPSNGMALTVPNTAEESLVIGMPKKHNVQYAPVQVHISATNRCLIQIESV